mgnify:CR=1 FL=1
MIIDYVYEQLRNDSVCDSAYEYSRIFLGRSSSYYSVLKAQNREPTSDVLLLLEAALMSRTELYMNNNYPHVLRIRNNLLEMHKIVKDNREQQIMMRFITQKDA